MPIIFNLKQFHYSKISISKMFGFDILDMNWIDTALLLRNTTVSSWTITIVSSWTITIYLHCQADEEAQIWQGHNWSIIDLPYLLALNEIEKNW